MFSEIAFPFHTCSNLLKIRKPVQLNFSDLNLGAKSARNIRGVTTRWLRHGEGEGQDASEVESADGVADEDEKFGESKVMSVAAKY